MDIADGQVEVFRHRYAGGPVLPWDYKVRTRFSVPGLCLRAAVAIFARVASVAHSRSSHHQGGGCWRCRGLKQTRRRAPGNSGLRIVGHRLGDQSLMTLGRHCRITPGGRSPVCWKSTVRRADIQSRPTGNRSVLMRAEVDHASVALPARYLSDPEAVPDLADLGGQRGRVGGVAGEDFDRDRTAVSGAEQAEDHLLFPLLSVAVVTEGGQRALLPLEVGRGHVVEDQGGVVKMPAGKTLFDPGLAVAEPVEHVEQLVSRDAPEAEQDPEAAVGGLGGQGPGGGELRGRVDEACDDGGQCEVALATGLSVEDAGKTELGRQAEQGRHMPVWQRPSDGGGIVEGFKDDAALEESADGVDDGFGDFRKGWRGSVAGFVSPRARFF